MIEIVLQSFIISQLHIIPKAKIGTHVAATETRSHGGGTHAAFSSPDNLN